ncbi:MAG: 23S rRNA (guanosine(2251)-2'-O)-methyltransferase RlmB [Candidatus Omnitrophica bacterium]|nr:23S rRNA (guanosine(2251)-2'-O)-methyltransferase RlmB [Candidatus Omnitrophota bacterium]
MAKNFIVLYGRNSIRERLKADPASVKKVFLRDNLNVSQIEELIKENNIPSERVSSERLTSMRPAKVKDLQGVLARVNRFKYAPFDELVRKSNKARKNIIFLDRISDPHNLGVIIRIAACFGDFAIVIPKFNSCEVNETVLHVASGGDNYCPICMVPNISNAIVRAKEQGYCIMGTLVGDEAADIDKIDIPSPVGLVLGSEGAGIKQGIKRHLDLKARIPMKGADLSFNVSIACAIFCHEISKKRGERG